VLTGAMGAVAHADKCVPDPNAICPFIYAPVTCNNGVTYSNQCVADAASGGGCHPAKHARRARRAPGSPFCISRVPALHSRFSSRYRLG
jgi:hypothetical protein